NSFCRPGENRQIWADIHADSSPPLLARELPGAAIEWSLGYAYLASQPTTRRVAREGAVRRPQPGKRVSRGRRANWRVRAILGGVALILVLGIWAVFARAFAPAGNTSRSRFDAIIVLGTPAYSQGQPDRKSVV